MFICTSLGSNLKPFTKNKKPFTASIQKFGVFSYNLKIQPIFGLKQKITSSLFLLINVKFRKNSVYLNF
jgi:hypothetical protein